MLQQALRQHLRQTCSEQELHQWFDPLDLRLDDAQQRLEVRFPHPHFARWFEAQALERFTAGVRDVVGTSVALVFPEGIKTPDRSTVQPPSQPPLASESVACPFGAAFTFDAFITNRKNQFPLAAAREAARNGHQRTYNPFVLCGASGNGKTHLLRALANELAALYGTDAVFCGSAEELHDRYNTEERLAMRRTLCAHRALLLDDLHRLRALPDLREELTALFDHFYDHGKQMAFAYAGRLSDLDFLEAPLRSRLELGLIVDLKEPDLDVRVRYIHARCAALSLQLAREHVLTLAQRCHEFRHLSGLLLKVAAYRDMVGRDILDRELEQILRNTDSGPERAVAPDTIISAAAEHFGVTPRDILSDKRQQHIVQARQVAMFLCRELIGSSFPALGRMFGGKDHSTAMYAVKKIKKLQYDNKDMHALLAELKRRCLNHDG